MHKNSEVNQLQSEPECEDPSEEEDANEDHET